MLKNEGLVVRRKGGLVRSTVPPPILPTKSATCATLAQRQLERRICDVESAHQKLSADADHCVTCKKCHDNHNHIVKTMVCGS